MIKLSNYGPMGVFLESKGWKVTPSRLRSGTAACDARNKTILVIPKAFYMPRNKPNVRVLQYVIRHEIWHALHAELLDYECTALREKNNLTWKSAVEVVAEAGCLHDENTPRMQRWVKASVLWHGRVGYKYSYKDVLSLEAKAVVDTINRMLKFELEKMPRVADGRL